MLSKVLWCLATFIPLLYSESSEILSARTRTHNSTEKNDLKPKLSEINVKHGEKNGDSCSDDDDCLAYYPGINYALGLNSTLVHKPYCDINQCTCGKYCRSKSLRLDNDEPFYYCGPCGRVGSSCLNGSCTPSTVTVCEDGYCSCTSDGEFYDLYYCYISYYGYEIALQLAISTCIAIALCLLVASIYNAIGFRRIRRMQDLRNILRSESGVRESPPDDIPPKYEDVVEDLPSYQDALKMSQSPTGSPNGIINEAFEDDTNSLQDEAIKDESPPLYTKIPAINRKKAIKRNHNINSNTNIERNINNPTSSGTENVINNLEKGDKGENQNDFSITTVSTVCGNFNKDENDTDRQDESSVNL